MVFKGRKIFGRDYVSINGWCIQGWFHQSLFKIVLRPGTKDQVLVGAEVITTKFPALFSDKLVTIKGFQHKIVVKESANPIKRKMRSVPFLIRVELERELGKLYDSAIIEPMESSLWFSPLVVVHKKSSELRVC